MATILIAGTIALSSSSFMTIGTVQAQQYYNEMDNDYNSYEPEYPSYKADYNPAYPSYEKDNRDKSTKDSSKNIDIKRKCSNTNLNINGNNAGNVSIGNKGTAEEGYVASYSSGDSGYGDKRYYDNGYNNNKQDKGFDCVINNNNNNTNIGGGGNQTIPPEPSATSLSVSKTIKCTPSVDTLQGACDAIEQGTGLPAGQITPNEFNIFVTGNNPNPSQFDGSTTPVVVTLGPGAYQVSETEDLSIQGALSAVVAQFPEIGGIVGGLTFSGDCDPAAGTGTITAGESQTCNIENAYTLNARP